MRQSNRSISSEGITYAAPYIMQAAKRETDGTLAREARGLRGRGGEKEEEEEGCGRGPVSTSA